MMIVTPAVTCCQGQQRRRSLLSVNIDAKHGLHFASAEMPDCQTSGCWQTARYLCCMRGKCTGIYNRHTTVLYSVCWRHAQVENSSCNSMVCDITERGGGWRPWTAVSALVLLWRHHVTFWKKSHWLLKTMMKVQDDQLPTGYMTILYFLLYIFYYFDISSLAHLLL